MNDVYFVCYTCKNYIDAGYRWCYVNLERPGIIINGEAMDAETVLGTEEYWKGVEIEGEQADWLRRDLPQIRKFLEEHRNHHLVYTEAQNFLWDETELEWLHEGQDPRYVDISPRWLIEKKGFARWSDALEWVREERPDIEADHWYGVEDLLKFKNKFESLVRERQKKKRKSNSE